jgi:hypothetical protein
LSENFATLVDDATFRSVLTMIQNEGLKAFFLDIETAFLYGELEEEIYMKVMQKFWRKQLHLS